MIVVSEQFSANNEVIGDEVFFTGFMTNCSVSVGV